MAISGATTITASTSVCALTHPAPWCCCMGCVWNKSTQLDLCAVVGCFLLQCRWRHVYVHATLQQLESLADCTVAAKLQINTASTGPLLKIASLRSAKVIVRNLAADLCPCSPALIIHR